MSILDIARTDVVTVHPEATVEEIAGTLRDEKVGSVVVVDEKGTVAGIVTDRDIVTYVIAGERDPGEVIANDILAPHVFSVASGLSVTDAVAQLAAENVRRCPLVDDGELVGIVTLDDLVVLLARELRNLADVIEAESPPY